MRKPIVAIIGRPNVGKSTLFNALAGKRISIVDDTPGVTRDRIYADTDWGKYVFTLIDTGGIEPVSDDEILREMRSQAELAVEAADVVIFLVDVRDGVTDADELVTGMLRRSGKPVVLCVNKVDNYSRQANDIYEFYELGLGDPIPISAMAKQGLGELLDEVIAHFGNESAGEEEEAFAKVAVVGRPNVGKSSIINKLLGEDRLIVSDRAGTTRDAVDTLVRHDGEDYIFIDTAGLRRRVKVRDNIERYSVIRTVSAVERADIAVIVIDASEGITEQDIKIAGISHERGKGAVILVNKWDIAPDKDEKSVKKFTEEIRQKLAFMPYAEILFVSALTGQRLYKLYDVIARVRQNQLLRVKSGLLNEILTEAAAMHEPPQDKGRRLRMYYATQVAVAPPTIVIFVNDRALMHFSYQRYIENRLREAFGWSGTPVRFLIRERKKDT